VACTAVAAYYYHLKGNLSFDYQPDRDSEAIVIADARKRATLASASGNYKEAGVILDAAMLRRPGDPGLMHERAVLYLKTGKGNLALPLLNEVLAKQPGDQAALLDRASALYMTRSYGAALGDYETLAKIKSSSYLEGANLGRALCHSALAQNGLAIHQCRVIVEKNPKNIKAMELLANCYLNSGDTADAIEAYTSCMRLESRADFYYGRALAYLRDHRYSEASGDLKKAVQLAPDNKDYAAKLQALESARKPDDLKAKGTTRATKNGTLRAQANAKATAKAKP
jgi:tetratricopeptide (TPR) repeat protein